MQAVTQLHPERYYHIYNRGNNRENLFHGTRDYRHFLQLYSHHISPIADTFAYCLMRNHFHVLLKIKSEAEWRSRLVVEERDANLIAVLPQAFSNFFNAYAKWFNLVYERTGSLFERRFKRIEIASDSYFTTLVFYIHFNPQKHGFVDDFREWKWSSYVPMLSNQNTKLQRATVLEWFDGRENFERFHQSVLDEKKIAELTQEDFE